MTPVALIGTAMLLGLFVLAAGAYAALYSIGRMWARPALVHVGGACWCIAFAIAVVIALATPLDFGWKLLILGSAIAYAVIPPSVWRYFERTHAAAGHAP